jgi:hypothetical protein
MFRFLPFFLSLAAATNLCATHYYGNVYTLSLDSGNYMYSPVYSSSLSFGCSVAREKLGVDYIHEIARRTHGV